MTTVAATALMALGLAGVLRAAAIVMVGGSGRFPLDPWVSVIAGFGLILLGRLLLDV